MKISNSKKQLAKIIHENGGWRDGAWFVAQDKIHGARKSNIGFYRMRPILQCGDHSWRTHNDDCGGIVGGWIDCEKLISNWHQTILSREEYFHLCPAPDAVVDEPEHIWTNPPSIEQLAADYRNAKDYAKRKREEADDAKADADARLKALELAGEALGLLVSPINEKQEPELVITDWRDLQVGDIIQCVGSWEKEKTDGMQLPVTALEVPHYNGDLPIRVEVPGISCPGTWGINFKFIRRP